MTISRFKLSRDYFIPKGAVKVADKLSDAIAYVYTDKRAKPCAAVFFGKQTKPVGHHAFRSGAEREKIVTRYFEDRRARAKRVADSRAEQVAFKHGVTVGDIFKTCWGYDQTNVEFFEVVEVRGKHAVLREIACASDELGGPQERVVPQSGEYLQPRYEGDDRGQPIRRLIQRGYNNEPNVRIHDCAMGYPWGTRGPGGIVIGAACSRTGFGWGH